MKDREPTHADVRKAPRTKSIWDDDVDFDKVSRLSPEDRHRLFPNDFAPDGMPYGDF